MNTRLKTAAAIVLAVPAMLLAACTSTPEAAVATTASSPSRTDNCAADDAETTAPPTSELAPISSPAALTPKPAASQQYNVTVDPTSLTGAEWNPTGVGLSIESLILTDPGFDTGNLAAYMKTLGPGILRVGGNSADLMFWTSKGETAPAWAEGTMDPAAIQRLAKVAKESGWGVILTVNLKQQGPTPDAAAAAAAEMAACAKKALGSYLRAIEIGNEDDFYLTDPVAAQALFTLYKNAIQQAVPGIKFTGPDSGKGTTMDVPFVNGVGKDNVYALTTHQYVDGACENLNQHPTMDTLLNPDRYAKMADAAAALAKHASDLGVTALYSEAGSFYCQGQEGVSDTQGAALQVLSQVFKNSASGVSGTNLHGTDLRCDAPKPQGMMYSWACAPETQGEIDAKPVLYGLLTAKEVPQGKFVKIGNNNPKLHVFGVQTSDKTVMMVVVSEDDPSIAGGVQVNVGLQNSTLKSATSIEMAGKGAGGLAAPDVTLGGAQVSADGTFGPPTVSQVPGAGSTLIVDMDRGTAMVLDLSLN